MIHSSRSAAGSRFDFALDDWQAYGDQVPTLVDLMPSGRFLMEEFYYAGGLPAVLRALGEHGLLDKDALTVTGQLDLGQRQGRAELEQGGDPALRQTADRHGGIGSCAATSRPRRGPESVRRLARAVRHRGRAVVFETIEDYKAKIDDDSSGRRRDLRDGAQELRAEGLPGMAEVGNMGLPPKLLRQGVSDMVRISDARMSGTAYGTVSCTSPRGGRGRAACPGRER